jgi:hypothetical protein
MLVEQLLQVDLPHYFLVAYAPVDEPAVEASRYAEFSLFGVDELDSVDNVVVTLVEQFGALQTKVVQANISLVIADSDCAIAVDPNRGDIVEVRVFGSLEDVFHEDSFFADIEGVDMLP